MTSKLHLALNTHRFDDTVAFYRAFLGREPVKHKPGYAKFDVDDPGLNLTLNQAPSGTVEGLRDINHLGIQVTSSEQVEAAKKRLEELGFDLREERDTDCCYALQDKVWITDPDGRAWEVFVVKVGDTRPDLQAPLQASAEGAASSGSEPAQPCC